MSDKRTKVSDKVTERLTLRLTPHEAGLIDAHRGPLSRSAYLRSLLEDLESPEPVPEPSEQPAVKRMRKRTDPEFTPDPEDVALQEAPLVPSAKSHVHRRVRGEQVGFDKGVKLYAYTCKEPGCGWTFTPTVPSASAEPQWPRSRAASFRPEQETPMPERTVENGRPLGAASGAEPGFWERLGTDDAGMPAHLPIGVNVNGHGPENDSAAYTFTCWCGDVECPLSLALGHAWASGRRVVPLAEPGA